MVPRFRGDKHGFLPETCRNDNIGSIVAYKSRKLWEFPKILDNSSEWS